MRDSGFVNLYHLEMLRPYNGITPRVHPTAFVDLSAQVIGDVEIGEASSVWMNAVLRGDVHWIRIGARSNVHGCTLHDRVLVGMGAILLSGVVVGEDSIVAAGTLLTEGPRVPPRSLVMGSPARVRRELSDEDVASIRYYSAGYVAYRLDYMDGARAESAR